MRYVRSLVEENNVCGDWKDIAENSLTCDNKSTGFLKVGRVMSLRAAGHRNDIITIIEVIFSALLIPSRSAKD